MSADFASLNPSSSAHIDEALASQLRDSGLKSMRLGGRELLHIVWPVPSPPWGAWGPCLRWMRAAITLT